MELNYLSGVLMLAARTDQPTASSHGALALLRQPGLAEAVDFALEDVWAETYDRALQDIFAVQDEITESDRRVAISIASAIRARAGRASGLHGPWLLRSLYARVVALFQGDNSLEESNIMSFEGKVSVVTGSALGIGEAIAIALAVKGSDVVGLDIRAPENLAVAERARTIGRRASAIYCDVADRESVRSAAHRIGEEFGRVDILINNAGIFEMTPIADMDFDRMIDSYDRQFGVNAKGTFLVTAALLPLFSSSEGGDIVNVITNHVHKDRYPIYPGTSVYDGSKWAQLCLTEVWAEELKGRGIRVKGICPAATVTPMFRDTHAEPYTGAMDAEDVALAVTNILEQAPNAAVGTSPLVVTRADAEALAVG